MPLFFSFDTSGDLRWSPEVNYLSPFKYHRFLNMEKQTRSALLLVMNTVCFSCIMSLSDVTTVLCSSRNYNWGCCVDRSLLVRKSSPKSKIQKKLRLDKPKLCKQTTKTLFLSLHRQKFCLDINKTFM